MVKGDSPLGRRAEQLTRTEQTSPTDFSKGAGAAMGVQVTGLDASDPRILQSVIGSDEIHLYKSTDQHGNWIDNIRSRQALISPVETGHRACFTCLLHPIAMHSGRHLYWDPQAERFHNDDEANAMLSRPQRPKYEFMN